MQTCLIHLRDCLCPPSKPISVWIIIGVGNQSVIQLLELLRLVFTGWGFKEIRANLSSGLAWEIKAI